MTLLLSEQCRCGNDARYVNERGEGCCAICPLRDNLNSIQLRSVADLLRWAREFEELVDGNLDQAVTHNGDSIEAHIDALRHIIQSRPRPNPDKDQK